MERQQVDRGAPCSHDWIVALVSLLAGVSIGVHLASRTSSGVAFSNTRRARECTRKRMQKTPPH